MTHFSRYVGIDYSGAKTPAESLPGLRVYSTYSDTEPAEVPPPPGPRKYWSRRELAHWLRDQLREGPPTIVGIDHAFSFPLRYFEVHHIPPDWPVFLDDFSRHWPTDREHMYVDFIRDGLHGNGAARTGESRWRRLTDLRARTAKSPFHFDCQGSVAKSTHAGLPWLRFLRNELGPRIHFWPFDGWSPPAGVSVITEAYPALWNRAYSRATRNDHQHDAYAVARWLRDADAAGTLPQHFAPTLTPVEQAIAGVEGWIFGLP